MGYSNDDLNFLYDKTAGRCHICRKRLAFSNYGVLGARACWEVDHSNARARGGTDYLRNLLPACIPCNRSKQHRSTRSARREFGYSRGPVSAAERTRRTNGNIARGGGAGAFLGGVVGGPVGAVVGGVLGGLIGYDIDVE